MLDELPGDGRHAAGGGHPLALDQLKSAHRIPAAHHHQLGPAEETGVEDREAAGGVKERHRQQGRALGRVRIGLRRRLAPAQERAGGRAGSGEDVGVDIALGGERALGFAGGAGGVEDGRLVVGVDRHIRQRLVRQAGPGGRLADHAFQVYEQRIGQFIHLAADIDPLQRRAVGQVLGQALETLGVEERDLGCGIGEAVFQLRPGPPGVERGDDGAQGGGGVEGDRPFGQVAHDDGDPVALLDAIGRQLMRQDRDRAVEGLEGDALVLMDQKHLLAMRAASFEHGAKGRRGVLPRPRRHAANDHLLHFQRRPWRGQQGMGLGDGHGGPGRRGGGGHMGVFLKLRRGALTSPGAG